MNPNLSLNKTTARFTKKIAPIFKTKSNNSDFQPKKYPKTIAKNVGGEMAIIEVNVQQIVNKIHSVVVNWRIVFSFSITKNVMTELNKIGRIVRKIEERTGNMNGFFKDKNSRFFE